MITTNDQIRKAVEETVLNFINEFQGSPYNYLYESDLQSLLFAKLRTAIPETVSIHGTGRPRKSYNLSIVHTEYWKRIDIACINIESAADVPIRVHKGNDIHIYEVPLLFGIELKYRKMGDRFNISSCFDDLKKLQSLNIDHPLVLGFLQNKRDIEHFNSRDSGCLYHEVTGTNKLGIVNVVAPNARWIVESQNA